MGRNFLGQLLDVEYKHLVFTRRNNSVTGFCKTAKLALMLFSLRSKILFWIMVNRRAFVPELFVYCIHSGQTSTGMPIFMLLSLLAVFPSTMMNG